MKRRSTDAIIEELSDIIRDVVQVDENERYDRKSTMTKEIARFGDLLTPGLDISTSTSDRNSLLGHMMMLIAECMRERQRNLPWPTGPLFPLAGLLLTKLMAHPLVDINRPFYYYNKYIGRSLPVNIASFVVTDLCRHGGSELGESWQALFRRDDLDPNQSDVMGDLILHNIVSFETLRASVRNCQLDPQLIINDFKSDQYPLIAFVICRALQDENYCTLVDDFLRHPKVNPNVRVLDADIGDDRYDPLYVYTPAVLVAVDSNRMLHDGIRSHNARLHVTKAILQHPLTDISNIRLQTESMPAWFMNKMLAHESVDIHNIDLDPPIDIDTDLSDSDFDSDEEVNCTIS